MNPKAGDAVARCEVTGLLQIASSGSLVCFQTDWGQVVEKVGRREEVEGSVRGMWGWDKVWEKGKVWCGARVGINKVTLLGECGKLAISLHAKQTFHKKIVKEKLVKC